MRFERRRRCCVEILSCSSNRLPRADETARSRHSAAYGHSPPLFCRVWCILVHHGVHNCMAITEKSVRQSVTLPARVARRVKSLAKTSRTSANRIIVELIESGIEARQQEEEKRFIELAECADSGRTAAIGSRFHPGTP
jgi:predicted DNA-binding protein